MKRHKRDVNRPHAAICGAYKPGIPLTDVPAEVTCGACLRELRKE